MNATPIKKSISVRIRHLLRVTAASLPPLPSPAAKDFAGGALILLLTCGLFFTMNGAGLTQADPCDSVASHSSDYDNDTVSNFCDLDDDNDGIRDCIENGPYTDILSTFFVLSGSARQQNPSSYPGRVTLTVNSPDQAGAVMSRGKIDFRFPFIIGFLANFGTKDRSGSDGMAVVFHNDPRGNAAIGYPRSALGAGSIRNGIALEFDTWNGSAENWGDGNRYNWWMDHTSIWDTDIMFPGVPSSTDYLTTAIGHGNLEDGQWHLVKISWEPVTETLSYTLDGANAGSYTHGGTTDFVTTFFGGANRVHFGITAATGGLSNKQLINLEDFDISVLTSAVEDDFALSGSAYQRNSSYYPELVTLTTNSLDQAGAVMSWGRIGFCHPFTLAFQAYLGNKDWNGSDGMAVVFHNDPRGNAAIGYARSALGAGGIQNGIALEVDTWNGSAENWGDGNRYNWWMDHTSIWDTDIMFPGVPSSTDYLTTAIGHGNLEDGQWHLVKISWDPATRTLSYTLDGAHAGSYTHGGTTDDFFAEYFGGASRVHFGITAATGGLSNFQFVNLAGFDTTLLIEGDLDSDGDGVPNQIDLDSDNDGISDLEESGADYATLDANRNSRIDGSAFTDADRDGLADVIEDTYGENNGIPPQNTDDDGIPDFRDPW